MRGARQPGYGTVDFGEWNDIQLKINISENKYDLYMNYECIGQNLPFRNPTDKIRSIEFQLGNKSDLWLDNIKISSYSVNKKRGTDCCFKACTGKTRRTSIARYSPKRHSCGRGYIYYI